MAVNIYHHHVKKKCRIFSSNDLVIKHVCIEKAQFLRYDGKYKPIEEADHLCKALHIARKRTDIVGSSFYLVTECIPHSCSSNIVSTPRSRKSVLTTKQMSHSVTEHIKRDPFHSATHVGDFVEPI